MPGTWIVVADGNRARLFELAARDAPWSELYCFVNPEGRMRGAECVMDRSSRVGESTAATEHAPEPNPYGKSAPCFAQRLCDALERGRAEGLYDRIVLVAPPSFLGVLRRALGDRLSERVTAEVRRDLTALASGEIRARLPDRLLGARPRIRV